MPRNRPESTQIWARCCASSELWDGRRGCQRHTPCWRMKLGTRTASGAGSWRPVLAPRQARPPRNAICPGSGRQLHRSRISGQERTRLFQAGRHTVKMRRGPLHPHSGCPPHGGCSWRLLVEPRGWLTMIPVDGGERVVGPDPGSATWRPVISARLPGSFVAGTATGGNRGAAPI